MVEAQQPALENLPAIYAAESVSPEDLLAA
jgi:hypothetical protein